MKMREINKNAFATEVISSYFRSLNIYDFEDLDPIHKKVIAKMLSVAVEGLGINYIAESFVLKSSLSGYRRPDRFEDKISEEGHFKWRDKLVKESEELIQKFIKLNV